MSKEEKEAMEKLKKLANKRLFEETIYEDDLLSFTEYATINILIERLQKENQELKEELDYYKQKENQVFDERDYYEE